MRTGVNPEKYRTGENKSFSHRIIIPVYIPNTTEPYYQEALKVLDKCLFSLTETINPSTTAITIINNSSCEAADSLLKEFHNAGKIDKYVIYSENRGKVYSVVSESRASFESFITISDADVLFLSGWETAVFEIFREIPKSGVVSPLPLQNMALYRNTSVFFDNYFFGKIGHDKLVSDEDCELYLRGLGNSALLNRENRNYSWKEKQYFLKGKVSAILGAGHFVATYRKEIFDIKTDFPQWKFLKGFEDKYLDEPADILGWYRLSTPLTYAYHIGNRMDDFAANMTFDDRTRINETLISEIQKPRKARGLYWLRKLVFKVIKHLKKL